MVVTQTGVCLAARTSFRIGGVAREFYAPASADELRSILRSLHERGVQPFLLGGGANTLFPDGEFAHPVISTENLRGLTVEGRKLRAESGVRLNVMIQTAMRAGLGGLEGLIGIPGTAGGAVCMNAGGAGWSFGDHVLELGLLPLDGGPIFCLKSSEVCWGYRTSHLKGCVVAWVTMDLTPDSPERLRERASTFMRKKVATQPLGIPSAGCVFRNPPGASAGRWIESLGLKGLSRGGAKVSERHANFIVNTTGCARATDVLMLVEDVRSRVERHFGVRLETEIVLA